MMFPIMLLWQEFQQSLLNKRGGFIRHDDCFDSSIFPDSVEKQNL